MPINKCNNDQNIKRFDTKMSDHFTDDSKTKLTKIVNSINYEELKKGEDCEDQADLNESYDHMYATNTENGELNLTEATDCQSAESEVKFWKEWLILHLDLIQQQSDEILNKERTILILQQENEMLKERISCMERGAPFDPNKFYSNTFLDENLDMTQDSGPCDEDNKNCIELLNLNGTACGPIKRGCLSDSESQTEIFQSDKSEIRDFISVSANSSGNFDPMKSLKMSIRKKRLSNSSAVSNNESGGDEKRTFRKFKKRRKRVLKDSQILTTTEHYITESSKANSRLSTTSDPSLNLLNNANLEVPRWRVKVYASCYAMEGTENLDDEVYNKRHSRLEYDERRRKRWDVQRIREQRLIEKLKQRQDRMGSGSRSDEQTDSVQSLWPSVEDIKYLEVSEHLPVSAFGSPIPKISPSEFNLPWMNNPSLIVTKKVPAKRSTGRRKTTKR